MLRVVEKQSHLYGDERRAHTGDAAIEQVRRARGSHRQKTVGGKNRVPPGSGMESSLPGGAQEGQPDERIKPAILEGTNPPISYVAA